MGTKGLSVDVTTLPKIEAIKDVYTFKVSGRHEAFPNKSHDSAYFSFDVYVYKNGIYTGRIALNNLLNLYWYDGSAHFHDSSKHHFDIWCTGSANLCSFLRPRVPTNTSVGYDNWQIDWTIWNYGSQQYNATYFIRNILTQIANYYTLQYASSNRSKQKLLNSLNTNDWTDNKIKAVPNLYMGSEEFIEVDENESLVSQATVVPKENLNKKSEESSLFEGLTEEEIEEMKRIEEEESIDE